MIWHITKQKKNINGKYGRNKKRKNYVKLGVSEEVIAELRDYDWNCFKQERNYKIIKCLIQIYREN